jgi:hypothetical protein
MADYFEIFKRQAQKKYPKLKIRSKQDHFFWKRMPSGLKYSGITLGNTIWLPKEHTNVGMLAHEVMHYEDIKRYGFINFYLLYLFPQSLFFIFFPLFLLFLVLSNTVMFSIFLVLSIISLLPLPSYTRAWLELRGYKISLYALMKRGFDIGEYEDYLIGVLTGFFYYKMVWNKDKAKAMVYKVMKDIKNEEIDGETFKDLKSIIEKY